ncbi:MAG: MFS transporter [Crenarchaeota archaeon]|nr:MFS transporter [Thermoproteota archaeon]
MARPKGLIVGLDLLFMSVNFSALTLFAALSTYVSSSIGLNKFTEWLASAVYSAGIFAAFFIGHSKFTEMHPRKTVFIAAVLASIPQFLIPYAVNPWEVVVLRFIQGMVMMALPIFSSQVGLLFAEARPLALGIILSGIFVGGLIGSSIGPLLAVSIGWRATYVLFGIAMLIAAIIWIGLTPRDALPVHKEEVKTKRKVSVWRDPFTLLWGFSFFPAIWIIFTLAPLISFIVESMGAPGSVNKLSSTVLEASYLTWSIIIGGVAYVLAKRRTGTPRNMFNTFASVQLFCFIITFIGVLIVMNSHNVAVLLLGLVLVAMIQGTGPTFWSAPSTAYPEDLAIRAGYALGLISNSAALVGPMTSVAVHSVAAVWGIILFMALLGAVLTFIGMKMKLPIEKYSEERERL